MKKLLKYLSPFAPDQSGACGVLYELGGLIVICDAGGCAGNVCGFDEPRWFTKKSAVFSAGLRDMDAIMGRDDKLIQKLATAQESINAKFTAIVGTPVPAVIATDMKALKRMAEKRLGVPCISVYCDGTKYYDVGEETVWLELFKEYAGDSAESSESGKNVESDRVGIIGATPLETGFSEDKPLKEMCSKYGIDAPVIYSIGTSLEDIKNAPHVQKNLVVSVAGLKAAEYLKEKYGTPYEVGFPFIPEEVQAASKTAVSNVLAGAKDGEAVRVLIIHTQFAANELRNIIRNDLDENKLKINNATWFMQDERYTEEGDFRLTSEDELWEIAESGKYDVIIADGDIERLLTAAGYKGEFAAYAHFAVSGQVFDGGLTLSNM